MLKSSLAVLCFVVSVLIALPATEGLTQPSIFGSEEKEVCCSYEVILEGSPSDEATGILERALYLFRYIEAGAPSIPLLRRRAESDHEIAKQVMRSLGYYEAAFESTVEPDADGLQAKVRFTVVPGRPFLLSEHRIEILGQGPQLEGGAADAKELGSPVGEAAVAGAILAAENALIQQLRRNGYPYAARASRDALADPDQATLSVRSVFRAGPRVVFGEVGFEGIPDIDETYLRTYLPWKKGDPVDVDKLAEFQRELIGTGLFKAGSVALPESPPPGENAPVAVMLEQRPFRTIAAGAWYSTDEGPGARLEFWHRNLFGANESIHIRGEGSLEERRIETRFRKPQFQRPRQDLVAGLSVRHIEDEAFDERGGTATLGLERQLLPELRAGLGGLAEVTETKSSDAEGVAMLFGVPGFLEFNNTDDPLDPTEGARARVTLTPFVGTFDSDYAAFLRGDFTASTYFDLTGEKRYVFAIRGRAGSIAAQDLRHVPAGRRMYSGGGGSVRGYAERFIGPLDTRKEPTGGLSVIEAGAELRARIYGDVGAAVFLEGASVSEEVVPTFSDGLQYAAGIGLRYYSPIGPIRVDVGVPLNKRRADDAFQVYFSIGQAF